MEPDGDDESDLEPPALPGSGTSVSVGPCGRVLLVDDDQDNRILVAEALTEDGFEIAEVKNGREAIDYLLRYPEPDIILLDLLMPGLSGWDVLKVLRTYSRLRRIPVIVVSAEPAVVQVPGEDVVARLRKPYRLHELLALVHRYARRKSPKPPA